MAPSTRGGIKRKQQELENTKFKALNTMLQNGWISARDLCRLEQVNKEFKQWVTDDEAWKTLTILKFPNTDNTPPCFVRAMGGFKMLYRHRIAPPRKEDKRKLPPMPPPNLKNDAFMFLVDITVGGESAFSDSFTGNEMDSLVQNGSSSFQILEPFPVGKAQCWLQRQGCSCGKCKFDRFQYDARVHFLRIDNADAEDRRHHVQCCVYSPSEKGWSHSMKAKSIGNGKYDWKTASYEWLKCYETYFPPGREGLVLQRTSRADQIERRLCGKVCFRFSIRLSVVEPGDTIAVTGFNIQAVYRGHGQEDWNVFDKTVARKTGVSLLHVLEQLEGSDGDPTVAGSNYVYRNDAIVSLRE